MPIARANGLLDPQCAASMHTTPQSTRLGLKTVIHVPNYMDHYSFTDTWGMDGWVGHIGWPTADGLTTNRSPVQLAVWRRIGKVRRPRHGYYAPPVIGGGIKRWCCLTSVWCLSVSDTSLSSSKGQRSKSPGRFTHRGLNAWCRCSGDHEDVLGAEIYCYVASARRRVKHFGARAGGEGRGRVVSARAQLVAS